MGCGVLVAAVVLVLAFQFGPWAVLGWILVVLVALAVVGRAAGD